MSDVRHEYDYLTDKAQRCFNRLRDLAPYGDNRWEHYFHKAFHIFSKLWKFQQENRAELTEEGLKRWEIGDMASKIGQLYYNYYLRTSETRFLHESYVFYEAIRSRQYFLQAANEATLAIKQLRYFARFIIICLLLNRKEEVFHLVQEFQALISSYLMKYSPADAQEWRLVIHEITSFMAADVGMPGPRSPASPAPFKLNLRCSPGGPEARMLPHRSRCREAVFVGYYPKQVKIAELPLDSFRMLLTMEWDDSSAGGGTNGGAAIAAADTASVMGMPIENGIGGKSERGGFENPRKHLAYRPAASTLLATMASTVESMHRDAVMLLYISARSSRDAGSVLRSSPSTSALTSEIRSGPIEITEPGSDTSSQELGSPGGGGLPGALFLGPNKVSDPLECFLYPQDLAPLTRRTVFLVVDSDVAHDYGCLSSQTRGRPMFCLMSPSTRSLELCDPSKTGSLLTMFLTTPLLALALVCGVREPEPALLTELQAAVSGVLLDWGNGLNRALTATRSPWAYVFRDVLLRRLILRFVLATAVLTLHSKIGADPANLPRCFPELPYEVSPSHRDIVQGVAKIAAVMGKEDLFPSARGLSNGPEAVDGVARKLKAVALQQ